MKPVLKLVAFGAVLLAVFGLAIVAARALAPAAKVTTPAAGQEPGHGDAETGHSDQHDHAAGAEPVRGLAAAQDGHRIDAVSAPRDPRRDGRLSFRLSGPDGPLTAYTTHHEKDLHLIVVRTDGRHFRHVHPVHDGDGGWSLPWRWTAAGTYRIFADVVPRATGKALTLTSTVEVAGDLNPEPVTRDVRTTAVEGFAATVTGDLVAGSAASLRFTVTRGGQPVTTLQPYLGAAGHLVALRAGDLAYLHVHPTDAPGAHPDGSGPHVSFEVETPTPGRYLLYVDFSVDGRVHTAAVSLTAR